MTSLLWRALNRHLYSSVATLLVIRPTAAVATSCVNSTYYPYFRYSYAHGICRNYAKKAKKLQQTLSEEDHGVIDLSRVVTAMDAATSALKYEYSNTIITRITPASLDRVSVEIDGQKYSLKQVAQIGMPNPQTIIIDLTSYPQAVDSVVSAIRESDLNLNPIQDKSNTVKVPIPKMTKELRENLVKLAKSYAEKAKVGVRKARQKAFNDMKKKDSVSKDTIRRLEKHVQQLTDSNTDKIDELLKAKTMELMK